MRNIYYLLFFILIACNSESRIDISETEINNFIDQWHKDVAEFREEAYFSKMDSSGVFIGTDPSEVWSVKEFSEFAKPFFTKKKTWNFTPLERNIYFSDDNSIVWFDEILDTWMGVCRGSGVIDTKKLKIKHYVLSFTIPNENTTEVISINHIHDSLFIKNIK